MKYIQSDPYSNILILQICSPHLSKTFVNVSVSFWIIPFVMEKSSHTNNVKVVTVTA